jgi:hypothetical protein
MTPIRIRTVLFVCFAGLSLSACGGGKDAIKADSVVIDDGHNAPLLLGEIRFGLGGMLGGQGATPEPAGPVIVYILKDVPKSYVDEIYANGFRLENNAAYLLPEGSGYNGAAIKLAEFIRNIDPKLSDEELAKSFGVVIDK